MKLRATRNGLAALLAAAALTLASCGAAGSAAGGGQVGGPEHGDMDHGGSGQGGRERGNVHEGMGHGKAAAGKAPEKDRASGGHGEHGGAGAMAPAVAPEEAGVEVETEVTPESPAAGKPVEVSYRVSDAGSGEAITELSVDHQRQMHLIAVSRDLERFQHVHPQPGPDGDFAVTAEFPRAGTYVLYDEFKRGGQTVLDRRELEVGGGAEGPDAASLSPDTEPKTAGGLTASLEAPDEVRAGREATFTYTLKKEDGAPADDLEPYLGAAAHVAIVSEDTREFAHTHGEASNGTPGSGGGHGGTGHAGHGGGRALGPEIAFTHAFGEPGLYKVWAQFNHHGDVVAVPFVVEVI